MLITSRNTVTETSASCLTTELDTMTQPTWHIILTTTLTLRSEPIERKSQVLWLRQMARWASDYSNLSTFVTNVQTHKEERRWWAECEKEIQAMCITLFSVYLRPLPSLGEEWLRRQRGGCKSLIKIILKEWNFLLYKIMQVWVGKETIIPQNSVQIKCFRTILVSNLKNLDPGYDCMCIPNFKMM